MRGRVLAVGIASFAIGAAAFMGNKVGAMASSGGACVSSCSGPTPVLNAPSIPSLIIYVLLAVGVIVMVTGLLMKGPNRLAT